MRIKHYILLFVLCQLVVFCKSSQPDSYKIKPDKVKITSSEKSKKVHSDKIEASQSKHTQREQTKLSTSDRKIQSVDEKKQASKDVISDEQMQLPRIQREFRGVWVASVSNINWPSQRKLSVSEQKQEIDQIIDLVVQQKLNVIILQVRPMSDALYKSDLEPWSYFLTGRIGQQPLEDFDPLTYWIEKAHENNIELHAWLNPYRAHISPKIPITETSVVKKIPQAMVQLANGMYWFDPAHPETKRHFLKVVRDIVSRYDIDGMHIDDYFYPYPEYNNNKDFPDDATWYAYKNSGGNMSKADWRRAQVNEVVEAMYKIIKLTKPYVKFGISPFGIYKNGVPEGVVGLSQYDVLYADPKLWLNEGWLDYISPQLYWTIDSKKHGFEKLFDWWQSQNTKHRHLWPGLNTVGAYTKDKPTEIVAELKITKQKLKENAGAIHWSIAGISESPVMQKKLSEEYYTQPAISPAYPWIKIPQLQSVDFTVEKQADQLLMKWNNTQKEYIQSWVIYTKYNNQWTYQLIPKKRFSVLIPLQKNNHKLQAIGLKIIDRAGNETPVIIKQVAQ